MIVVFEGAFIESKLFRRLFDEVFDYVPLQIKSFFGAIGNIFAVLSLIHVTGLFYVPLKVCLRAGSTNLCSEDVFCTTPPDSDFLKEVLAYFCSVKSSSQDSYFWLRNALLLLRINSSFSRLIMLCFWLLVVIGSVCTIITESSELAAEYNAKCSLKRAARY